MMGLVKVACRPHIHGADRHRQSLHAFDRAAVGLVLLFLVGQAAWRPMNRNSLRNRPTPTAPILIAVRVSSGISMLASSSTFCRPA